MNEGYEIFEETGPKNKNKEKAALGPMRGITQENQDQIVNLKSQKGRGGVVGEFYTADTTAVVLNDSQVKGWKQKWNISLEEN